MIKSGCPICGSYSRELLVNIKMEKFLGNKFKPIEIEKSVCNACGHIYANKYYDTTKHYEVTRASEDELIYYKEDLNATFTNLVKWIDPTWKFKPKTILDIGCGKCDLLRVLKNEYPKSELLGIDLAPQSTKFGAEYNINVKTGDIKDITETWDLITLTGVLEHQFNLDKFLTKLTKLCNDGTKVLVEVPDSQRILKRKDAKYMHDIYNDEHVHHFSQYGLIKLMGSYGFELIGSKSTNRDDWDVLDMKFVYNNLPKRFNDKSTKHIHNLHKRIEGAESIALYGAGWHSQAIIPSFYKLDNIKGVFDKDIRKLGMKLFGCEIQYPKCHLLDQFDCILISTMSKDDEIVAELHNMGIDKSKIVRMY